MIYTEIFVFNPFEENTILIYDDTRECVIIDAGCENTSEENELITFIERFNLKPVRLLNTHCHIDHIIGNLFIKEKYGLSPETHKLEEPLLNGAVEHARLFGIEIPQPPAISNYLTEGDTIKFGKSELKILCLPGHSPGSLAFYSEKQKFVLSGDVLFKGSIGRTDLPGGDFDQLIKNIKLKLFTLDGDMRVIPGHGPETTISLEKRSNPFFK